MSSVNYNVLGVKDELLQKHVSAACYHTLFHDSIPKKTTRILLHETKQNLPRSVQEVTKWCNDMNRWGFPIEYMGIVDGEHHAYLNINNKRKKCYKYKSHLNSALTLWRYLFESNLVTPYFEMCKTIGKTVNKFKAMQICHGCVNFSKNHALKDEGFFTLTKTRIEIFKNLLKGTSVFDSHYGYDTIHPVWETPKINGKINDKKDYKNIYKTVIKNKPIITKVFVVGPIHYANWLPAIKLVNSVEAADVIFFTGGEDVDPSLYNEPVNPTTGSNLARDLKEKEIFTQALALGKKFLGVCRGSQFLCVMAGGKLVQDQPNPFDVHEINLNNFEDPYAGPLKVQITSTHHQAAWPYNLPSYRYKILGWTDKMLEYHHNGEEKEIIIAAKQNLYGMEKGNHLECEVVYYSYIKALGIQGHPEFDTYQKKYPDDLKEFITIYTKFINDKL